MPEQEFVPACIAFYRALHTRAGCGPVRRRHRLSQYFRTAFARNFGDALSANQTPDDTGASVLFMNHEMGAPFEATCGRWVMSTAASCRTGFDNLSHGDEAMRPNARCPISSKMTVGSCMPPDQQG